MTSPAIRSLPYFISYSVPAMVLFGLWSGGWWTFTPLVVLFAVVPLVELILPADGTNPSAEEENEWKEYPLFSVLLWGHVVMQYVVLYHFLYFFDTPRTIVETTGAVIAAGLMFGAIGITVAHELIHRRSPFEQFLGKLLLYGTNYLHFFIEHIRGHHKTVGTAEDPVSAAIGESFYRIWFRAVFGSYVNAWRLEQQRLTKSGIPVLSPHNQMVRYTLVTVLLNAAVIVLFGGQTFVYFLLASALGFSLLEMVNYIEHYGLTRRRRGDGTYEKVDVHHSWSSNNTLSRWFLFELTRHSDHHLNASKKYQILQHIDPSPQHPTGYPGMIFLALIPPLWFSMMDPKAKKAMNIE